MMQGSRKNNTVWSQERTRGVEEQKRPQKTDTCGRVEIHDRDGVPGQQWRDGFCKQQCCPRGRGMKSDRLISSHTAPRHRPRRSKKWDTRGEPRTLSGDTAGGHFCHMRTEMSCTSKTQIPEKVKEKVDRFGYVKILKCLQ